MLKRVRLLVGALVPWLFACGGLTPASLQFQSVNPPNPTVGQGATLSFLATDGNGAPMEGVTVKFALQGSPPGVTLSTASALTGSSGVAQVTVTSNQRNTTVTVLANANGVTTTGSVSFASGAAIAANAGQLTFQCGTTAGAASGGIHAIGVYDQSRSMIAGVKLQCFAHVADRNGDGIANAPVSFLTEAGAIEGSATSVTDVVGNANTLYKSSLPLPEDVEPAQFKWQTSPLTGQYVAPLWMQPYEWSENPLTHTGAPNFNEPSRPDPIRSGMINNPRDNLVTLVAVTTGEEAFVDANGNGKYDPGEPFTDLPEPFVDANDNGNYDLGEKYVDVNGNGQWDGPNGKWDANTTIWTEERILWTGLPAPEDIGGTNPTVQLLTADSSTLQVPHFGTVIFNYFVADPWWNSIARNGNNDTCGSSTSATAVVVKGGLGTGIQTTYPAGEIIPILVSDAHDPSQVPQPAAYTQTVSWTAYPSCQVTSSPITGFVDSFGLPALTGTVL